MCKKVLPSYPQCLALAMFGEAAAVNSCDGSHIFSPSLKEVAAQCSAALHAPGWNRSEWSCILHRWGKAPESQLLHSHWCPTHSHPQRPSSSVRCGEIRPSNGWLLGVQIFEKCAEKTAWLQTSCAQQRPRSYLACMWVCVSMSDITIDRTSFDGWWTVATNRIPCNGHYNPDKRPGCPKSFFF